MNEPQSRPIPSVQLLTITDDEAGQRIDNYLIRRLKGVPKSRIYRILRKGEVRVNKGRIEAAYRLREGDKVRIPPLRLAQERHVSPGQRALDRLRAAVLYEDDRLLILDKPSGMAVHGGSGVNYGLIEAMRLLRPELKELELVHRLDRETSGCLILAKRRSALRKMHELIRANALEKRYLALVCGLWKGGDRLIDAPLRKNVLRSGERHVRVDAGGKSSATKFHPLEQYAATTLVEAQLLSGRTHQIRVHAAHLGYPLAGDTKYGDDTCNRDLRKAGLSRLFLHAHSLSFSFPDVGREIYVSSPLTEELQGVLGALAS